WAWFDEDAEQRYLTRLPLPQENDWRCGNRMWAIDLVAPFGHTRQMINLVLSELFPEHCFRALWHRGRERGKRVKHFRGYRVSRLALQDWQTAHPLCADVQECGLPGGRE
ncbi:toxin-activating lysine-acyltransferase, partial [Buttiauxella sp. A2-C2_NF]